MHSNMLANRLALLAGASLVAFSFHIGTGAQAQTAAALAGSVTSAEEPTMEGVIVSAKKEGANVTVSVLTDDKGKYSFPSGRLEPGKYDVSIRAVGYDLDGGKTK